MKVRYVVGGAGLNNQLLGVLECNTQTSVLIADGSNVSEVP